MVKTQEKPLETLCFRGSNTDTKTVPFEGIIVQTSVRGLTTADLVSKWPDPDESKKVSHWDEQLETSSSCANLQSGQKSSVLDTVHVQYLKKK